VTQPHNSTQPDDDDRLLDGEDLVCAGLWKADDPFRDFFRDLERRARSDALHAFAKLSKPKPQRKRSLKTVLDQAKKAGASSVTLPDGITLTLGQAATPVDRELAEFEACQGKA
jgi:hypothetical protein